MAADRPNAACPIGGALRCPADGRPRFQFGLPAVFVLTTGLGLWLGLVSWDPHLGSMLGTLLVAGGWAAAAARAGWRRLAYFLAAVAMGIVPFVLLIPISVATWAILEPHQRWLHVVPVACMCFATLMTAALLRKRIRRAGPGYQAGTALAAAYLAGTLFAVTLLVGLRLCGVSPGYLGVISDAIDMVVLASLVLTTLALPVTWPMAIWFVWLLRRIDPIELDLTETQRAILRAVGQLQARGQRPIRGYHVAEQSGCDEVATAETLERLRQLGALHWTAPDGYRRFR